MPVRGCIIKDELVTISNRQTNWTTLGLPPGAHDALSKTKTMAKATSWDIKIMTIPTEKPEVFHARNSTTRYFRRFVRPSIDTHTTPIRIRFGSPTRGDDDYFNILILNLILDYYRHCLCIPQRRILAVNDFILLFNNVYTCRMPERLLLARGIHNYRWEFVLVTMIIIRIINLSIIEFQCLQLRRVK